ncbi:bifunctional 4-hydroxy-2-oxoglutarate aldolase/2-dehydro-3-deoxy-phosphogluconate aldolase [Pedomonas mirosovicensis]|uniref:bifunctional 4-hydroxy-2-oxoglutarate aldolase/2-dehydro-3-deoxy-phosphogluconate aldolase n=1 Tax=Pedomonas mirosovicensis TaxID=2908641 RepID=UPI0021683A59|nr:bifunctional 4-hydroxy-2-oxoglutarate aldolase/2-dehydro-3-deoxy-phosphogluconate aldolase [Pedomonas mirosovicensis]MCH8686218.1 bifunctional 4-hydroxy-2-oxoglutarate aldolase/2-dehydro-3-deoxy-phosphogluconate aldolase [Pedomonas mirosovicensis]
MTSIASVMQTAPVIPVLVVDDVAHAVPLAEALVAGGLPVLEVTLRTPAALDVIRAMSTVKGALVGAGTVLNGEDLQRATDAGAQFIVSPGLTRPLAEAAKASGVPFLPGVATAGDIMRGLDLGLDHFKFFPAESSGGLPALKALAAPFFQCRFCPTGGITEATASAWLAHPQIYCVGGSWIAPASMLKAGDWAGIEAKARQAAQLRASI